MDVTRHDANLALTRLDNTGAVRSDQSRFALGLHDGLDLDHIESGDALSDANDEVHLGLDSLQNGVGSEGRRNVDNGSLSVSGSLGLGNGAEDGKAEMLSASFAFVDTTDDLGAVGKSLLGMEGTLYQKEKRSISEHDCFH